MQLPVVSQHPSGHDAALQLHVPAAVHSPPCAQVTHAPPCVPQAVLVGVTHCPLSLQQPDAQDSLVHVHVPAPVHA
jgi:hypothetical protein